MVMPVLAWLTGANVDMDLGSCKKYPQNLLLCMFLKSLKKQKTRISTGLEAGFKTLKKLFKRRSGGIGGVE
jgi:hypothetical protein